MAADALRLRVGLTGGIGSGKSTVADLLQGLGAALIDTDRIARELTSSGGAAIDAIERAFGPAAIDVDGALDRAWMRGLAFSDAGARRRLEAVLHPLIGREVERRAEAVVVPVIVFDVPLLVESRRWRAQVDKVLVVDCRETTQVARVVARSGWTADAVRAVIEQQASRRARRACADAVIYNDDIERAQLQAEVSALWQRWVGPRH